MPLKLIEDWRPVVGKEGSYEASNFGRVRSLPHKYSPGTKILKTSMASGYLQVGRVGAVHIAVAKAFIGISPSKYHEVNHKDGVKTNNCPTNLEWLLHGENIKHAIDNGLLITHVRRTAKLSKESVAYIRSSIEKGCDLAKRFGVSEMNISLIRNNKIWKDVAA